MAGNKDEKMSVVKIVMKAVSGGANHRESLSVLLDKHYGCANRTHAHFTETPI